MYKRNEHGKIIAVYCDDCEEQIYDKEYYYIHTISESDYCTTCISKEDLADPNLRMDHLDMSLLVWETKQEGDKQQ